MASETFIEQYTQMDNPYIRSKQNNNQRFFIIDIK